MQQNYCLPLPAHIRKIYLHTLQYFQSDYKKK